MPSGTPASDPGLPTPETIRQDVAPDDVPETLYDPDPGATLCLSSCEPFSALSNDVLHLLEEHMQPVEFANGEYLLRQGEPGRSLILVSDGVVEICTDDEDGGRHFIQRVGPGQVLGEMALLTEEPRSAHVIATSPVRVMVLPAARFHELARRHPEISVALTELLSTRLGHRGRDVLAGKVFHGYRIRQRLGRGGMAVVYEGEELAGGRRVALKMMSHRLVYDNSALEQFQREADMIESFDHANIARMYGRFAAFHTYFIAMQFCEGRTLHRLIRDDGPLDEPQFRRIIGQVASALAYAHAAGIIHRDLKPPNIMIAPDGTAMLMDFGLAKPVLDRESGYADLIVGTPRYMAPEQLAGDEVDQRADYFALGCVAWEMLTGRPLFGSKDTGTIVRWHATWTAPDLRERVPGLSDDVYAMVSTALAGEPEERNLNLTELAGWRDS